MFTDRSVQNSSDARSQSHESVALPLYQQKSLWLTMLIGVAMIASCILALSVGPIAISTSDVVKILFGSADHLTALQEKVVIDLRLPRMILAFLAGAGLALSGAVLQTVTRNPLADPYLFGISSGASFGAVLVIASLSTSGLLAGSSLMNLGVTGGAFIGSALSVALVLSLSGAGSSIERMLLAGVATSFMFGAATSLVLYMADAQAVASLIFWTLGSFTRANWDNLWLPAVAVSLSLLVFLAYSRQLRAMLSGDEGAVSLGVNAQKLRVAMLLVSSLLTATLVANCGGIGFVGLMIPHIVRRLLVNNSRLLYVASLVIGGVFMVWVDVLARSLLNNNELPVGVLTAAIGSVFFLLVLRRRF